MRTLDDLPDWYWFYALWPDSRYCVSGGIFGYSFDFCLVRHTPSFTFQAHT